MPTARVRTATLDDIPTIETIAVDAEMFGTDEVGFLGDQFRATSADPTNDAHWLVAEAGQEVVGATHYAPEPFSDRMWNLYFIAVSPMHQRSGIGKTLMSHVEDELRGRGGDIARTLIVETSSTEKYQRTRQFYASIGYVEEARVRQFYGPDDHKVTFWKSLVSDGDQ